MTLLRLLDDSDQFFSPHLARMLDAILLEEGQQDALREWASHVDFDAIKDADFGLIPALYARSGSHPALAPYEGRMKGIYRYYLYRNTALLAFVKQIFIALSAAKIEFIVFKGIAITMQYHHTAALRFASDCDILIHEQDRSRAIEILQGCGLSIPYDDVRFQQERHSHDFKNPEGHGLDLHWYALSECCWPGVDDGFWQRSRVMTWKGLEVRVLAPEDQLLVAGLNGTKEVSGARAEWICDAARIIAAHPAFNWALLREELARRKMTSRFAGALGMMARFIPHFPQSKVEAEFLTEIKSRLASIRAEDRLYSLDKSTLQTVLEIADLKPHLNPQDTVRHMRYTCHVDGSVAQLHVSPNLHKYLKYAFVIVDAAALRQAILQRHQLNGTTLELPKGAVRLPEQRPHIAPRLRLKAKKNRLIFSETTPGVMTIDVELKNLSFRPWIVHYGTDGQFGLTYHLYSKGWKTLNWVLPSTRFLVARMNQVAMILPRTTIDIKLDITRPPGPGNYVIRLDIEQGTHKWLDPFKRRFPKLKVKVL